VGPLPNAPASSSVAAIPHFLRHALLLPFSVVIISISHEKNKDKADKAVESTEQLTYFRVSKSIIKT
jgi:hypothetical protein